LKSSVALSSFLVGSLMLLVSFSSALTLNPTMASGMCAGGSGSSWHSTNWSGYAVTGSSGSVTYVQGSWIVPAVTGSRFTTAYSSFWVGIDGFSSSTVEQIGTDSDIQRGRPVYYAWYEFYPLQAMQTISGFTVKPGNTIKASVTYTSSAFTLYIEDVSTGQSFSITESVASLGYTPAMSSAEWIAEAPSSYFGVLPLANFGTVNFGYDSTAVTGTCYATVSGVLGSIGSFGTAVQQITMVSRRGSIKALPSSLSSDGTSFSVKWKSAGP
jgi:hypothetical protein